MDQEQATPVEDSDTVEDRLQVFGATLSATRDRWVGARQASGWDRRVAKDLDQYHMRDAATKSATSMMDVVRAGGPVVDNQKLLPRSTVFVGITRQKANAAEARLSDILLPTDDKNWGIKPTPDPECANALKDNTVLVDPVTRQPVLVDEAGAITDDPERGQPLTKTLVAQATQMVAKRAAESMEREIDDQLVECDYNAEVHKVLHDAAVIGTGVLKGPIVTKRTRKAWRERSEPGPDGQVQKVHILEVVEDLAPASFRVDPRMVWEDPDCGDDIQNGQGIFELEKLTEKRVRDLAKQPGYLKSQLRQVLEEGPRKNSVLWEIDQDSAESAGKTDSKLYYHWIYWGELRPEDLRAAGVAVPEEDDLLESISGCVEMINDTVVRAYLNPLDTGEIPYDFYPWEKVQGSPRGYGVPYLMASQQSVTNAGWRMMMDNAGRTVAGQIIVRRSAVTPADGKWTLTPGKFWYLNDEGADASKVFHVAEFASHQSELAAIIDMAEKIADQETATPMMAQGQQGSAPETVGGMQLLMNGANVVLRRLVKQFDDYITKKHIRRYYDYNMAYNPDDSIKGDFQVDARGSSALLVRDIQNQAYTNLLAAGANPLYTPLIDPKKLFEKALQAQHIDPKDIMLSDEQIQANREAAAQQPPDPRVQAAQINAQANLQKAQAIAQGQAVEVETRREAAAMDRELRVRELELERELAILKTAAALKQTTEMTKGQLAAAAIADRTKKELAASEMLFKATESPDKQGI